MKLRQRVLKYQQTAAKHEEIIAKQKAKTKELEEALQALYLSVAG